MDMDWAIAEMQQTQLPPQTLPLPTSPQKTTAEKAGSKPNPDPEPEKNLTSKVIMQWQLLTWLGLHMRRVRM